MTPIEKSLSAPVSIRLEEADREALLEIAASGDRTLTQEIRRAIKTHIQKHKQLRSLGKTKPSAT